MSESVCVDVVDALTLIRKARGFYNARKIEDRPSTTRKEKRVSVLKISALLDTLGGRPVIRRRVF